MFEQARPSIAVFLLGPLVMSGIFGAVTVFGGSPVSPEIYGHAVYEVPALAWATTQGSLSSIALFGVVRNLPIFAMVGLIGLALLFVFFAGMALSAGATGTLLVAMALGTAPICATFGWWAWRASRG